MRISFFVFAVLSSLFAESAYAAPSKAQQKNLKPQQQKGVELRPRQLAVGMGCAEAERVMGGRDYAKFDPDQQLEIRIVRQQCADAERNIASPNDPVVTVVTANSGAANDPDKVFFRTIKRKDVQAIRDICRLAGQQALNYLKLVTADAPVVELVDVVTDGGKANCEAYIRGLEQNSPFVVLAPNVINGTVVTVGVLKLIGLKKPAEEVQKAMDKVGQAAGTVVAKTISDVRKNPTILVAGSAGVATIGVARAIEKILPKDVTCRLKIRCKGLKCRHSCQ